MIGKMGWLVWFALLGLGLCSCQKWIEEQRERAAEEATPTSEPLSQSYGSPNGLLSVHYPADFAAKVVGKSGIMLSRNLPDGNVELLTFTSVDNPISTDVKEFSRVLNTSEVKELPSYTELSNAPKVCNGQPGVEVTATWQPEPGVVNYRRSCAFIRNGHGYSFAYTLPNTLSAKHRAQLDSIVESTSFNR